MMKQVRNLLAACLCGLVWLPAGVGHAQSPDDDRNVPKQLKRLASKDPKERAAACENIGAVGEVRAADAAPAVGPLCAAAKSDADPIVRAAAVTALGKIDPDPKKALPVLLALVKDDKADTVQLAAIYALGGLGPVSKEALPLLQSIRDKYQAQRQEAAKERAKFLKAGDKAQERQAQTREQSFNRWVQATTAAIRSIKSEN